MHISLNPGDGEQRGVGMPIIATFNRKITDEGVGLGHDGHRERVADQRCMVLRVLRPAACYAMECHYRPENYWPAHARIHMGLDTKGVSAGAGSAFDDSLSIWNFATGAA